METHHNLKIQDSALVAAANMAARYMAHRQLPDSAVDALDEAAASMRVQLDTRPGPIMDRERRLAQLRLEAAALKEEPSQSARVEVLEVEIADLAEELDSLYAQFEREREQLATLASLRTELETRQWEATKMEAYSNYEGAAELVHRVIPALERRIADLVQASSEDVTGAPPLLPTVLTQQQVASVVSRLTGIPVSRLSLSERERLLGLADELRQHVVGQDAAVDAVAAAILRSRAGVARAGQPAGSFMFLGPTGTGKTLVVRGDGGGGGAPCLWRCHHAITSLWCLGVASGQSAGGAAVRQRRPPHPHRLLRVHGKAHSQSPHRRPARVHWV